MEVIDIENQAAIANMGDVPAMPDLSQERKEIMGLEPPPLVRHDADHVGGAADAVAPAAAPAEADAKEELKFAAPADNARGSRYRSVFGTENFADCRDHDQAVILATALAESLCELRNLKYGIMYLEHVTVWHAHWIVHSDSQWTFGQLKTVAPRSNLGRIRTMGRAITYCKKGGECIWQFGEAPHQGATDEAQAEHIMSMVSNRAPMQEIMLAHPNYFFRYASGITTASRYIQPTVDIDEHILRPWQQARYDEFISNVEPPRRRINWVVDKYGNAGKSWFALWCMKHLQGVELFGNQKTADLALIIGHDPKIFIFDYSCSVEEVINYGVIEDVKNGFIISGKYASCRKIFARPHVLVMSNFEPDRSKFMAGRLHIIRLTRMQGVLDLNHGDEIVVHDEDV